MENLQKEQNHINKKIEQSTIFRFGWKDIQGKTLNECILRLRKKRYTPDETFVVIRKNYGIVQFCKDNPEMVWKVEENIKTSVCSVYCAQKTAEKIKFKPDKQ